MAIRYAETSDVEALLEIYGEYIATPTTFESELPLKEEFAQRIRDVQKEYPYLVWEENGHVYGYAYAHKFRERAAYRYSAELSVYIDMNHHSKGIGKKLYMALIQILKLQGVRMLYSGVTVPNIKSEGLHQTMGFTEVGTYHNAGYKFGAWRDVKWFEKAVGSFDDEPANIVPVHQLNEKSVEKILQMQL